MNMECDAFDPYGEGVDRKNPFCINTANCRVPGTVGGVSLCSPARTDGVVNVGTGVPEDPTNIDGSGWCPGPYRFHP